MAAKTKTPPPPPAHVAPRGAGNAPKYTTEDLMNALTEEGYSFRLNLLDDGIECNGEPMTDIQLSKIRNRLRDRGLKRWLSACEDAWCEMAEQSAYHPVKEYLSSLEWDGQPHIEMLAGYFKDAHNVFPLYLRKFLIGSVAKVFERAQNPMLALDAEQDEGKSWFAQWLCPLRRLFIDSDIKPENKDYLLLLATRWIWEVGELGATTRKADREALKHFITIEWVTVRKPYGRLPITKPAMASLIGTFNNENGILTDPTGSRRFNVCTLTQINWDYRTDMDVNQVWAEAYQAYMSGESYRLNAKQRKRRDEINQEFEVEDIIENMVYKCFTVTHDPVDWLGTADILITLQEAGLTGASRANAMALSAVLKKIGLKKFKFNRRWGYRGIK